MEQRRIWEHYQAGGEATRSMFKDASARHEHLVGIVPVGADVLNIGVGDGGMEAKVARRGCTAFSLDPSESSVRRVATMLSLGDRARVGVSQAIPFDSDVFDVVVMSEVIEHLDDDVLLATIAEVRRVLRDGGLFIGSTPADEELAASECLCPECGTIFHRYGHVQTFDERRLRGLLSAQFSEVRITRHYFPASGENWRGRIFRTLKSLQLRFGRVGSNETYVFVAGNQTTTNPPRR